jgi:hypothetical protein
MSRERTDVLSLAVQAEVLPATVEATATAANVQAPKCTVTMKLPPHFLALNAIHTLYSATMTKTIAAPCPTDCAVHTRMMGGHGPVCSKL